MSEQKTLVDDYPKQFIQNEDRKWTAWFMAIKHEKKEEVLKIWNEYLGEYVGKYLISTEVAEDKHKETDGEHYHFVAEISPKTYHKVTKRYKDKYNLKGQAKNGIGRQYGIVKEIKDIDRLIAYCMKDGQYETNFNEEELKKYENISFKPKYKQKDKNETFTQKITNRLIQEKPQYEWDLDQDGEILIDYILDSLGEVAKVFDEHMLKKMLYGVYNALPKTIKSKRDFRNQLKANILNK